MNKLYCLKHISLSYSIFDSETTENISIKALDDISLDIYENEFIAIAGRNGSGKTSLGKLMAGLAGSFEGELHYRGKPVKEYNREIFRDVGMVIQEPQNQLLMPTVAKELAYPLENRGVGKNDITTKVFKQSETFGLSAYLERSPDQLSGGQTTALALASILITEPETVILDEPDSHFDDSSKTVLRDFIARYRGKKTIILITQYPEAAQSADRVINISDGKSNQTGMLKRESIRNRKVYDYGNAVESTPCLEFQNVSYEYEKNSVALGNINLIINRTERVGIVGGMGAGKTTLGLIASGLLEPTQGQVMVAGMALDKYDEIDLRRKVSYSMQFPERALFGETVRKDIAIGPENLTIENIDDSVDKYINTFNIDKLSNRHPFALSGGEKRRAALAGILAMNTEIVILDEPTAALDIETVNRLTEILYSLEDKTIIIISHDIDFITANCNRVIELKQGRVEADMPVADFLSTKKKT